MRVRVAAATALAAASLAALTACGGSGGGGGGSTGGPLPLISNTGAASGSAGSTGATGGAGGSAAAFCAKLQQGSAQLGDLGSSVSDPAKLKDALGKTVSYFQELDKAAPTELQPSIEDLISGMKTAQQALANPSSADASALQKLATKLSTDAQKLASYTSAHCTGS